MKRSQLVGSFTIFSLLLVGCNENAVTKKGLDSLSATELARFNEEGQLLLPDNMDEWVFVGSSLGQRYQQVEFEPDSPGSFQVVRMEPRAYAAYKSTGKFPEGTMFSLSFYSAETDIPPNQAGYVMGDPLGMEVHVRSSERFESGSGFFGIGEENIGDLIATPNDCVACHSEHAGDDMVFDQFYPVLRD